MPVFLFGGGIGWVWGCVKILGTRMCEIVRKTQTFQILGFPDGLSTILISSSRYRNACAGWTITSPRRRRGGKPCLKRPERFPPDLLASRDERPLKEGHCTVKTLCAIPWNVPVKKKSWIWDAVNYAQGRLMYSTEACVHLEATKEPAVYRELFFNTFAQENHKFSMCND